MDITPRSLLDHVERHLADVARSKLSRTTRRPRPARPDLIWDTENYFHRLTSSLCLAQKVAPGQHKSNLAFKRNRLRWCQAFPRAVFRQPSPPGAYQ